MPKNMFLSYVAMDPAQGELFAGVAEVVRSAGWVVLPEGPNVSLSDRMKLMRESERVLICSDCPLPPGLECRILSGVQHELQVPFPPELQAMLDRAVLSSGAAIPDLAAKRKAILLPGETESPANAPKGMLMRLPPDMAVARLASDPFTLPSPLAMYELGVAVASNKRTAVVSFSPSSGDGIVRALGLPVLTDEASVRAWAEAE